MKVTVLVAVYNAEKYLGRCIDSLLAQSYTDIEIMCVDDCSTDTSLAILTGYATLEDQVHVIHLDKNQGQAVARNIAIDQSTGDLFCFVDSDDWLSPDAIEKAVAAFDENPNADCVLFRLSKIYADGTEEEYTMNSNFPMTGEQAFRLSLNWSIHGVYMVRADIQRAVLYDDTCRSYSDDNTTRLHYLRSREVDACNGTYFYYQNPQSVSHINNISRFNFLKANEHMQQILRNMHMPDDILNLHEQVRMEQPYRLLSILLQIPLRLEPCRPYLCPQGDEAHLELHRTTTAQVPDTLWIYALHKLVLLPPSGGSILLPTENA